MDTILIYALITSAAFYLGSRATITTWLWSRYPPRLASFMDCAACSGFWYGLLLGNVAHLLHFGAVGLLRDSEWYSPFVVALCSMVWTPIIAGYMQLGFANLGSAIEVVEDNDGG